MRNTDMTLGASLFTLTLCLLFGGNGVAMKLGFTGIGPFTSAGMRFILASLALLIWARIRRIPLKLSQDQFWMILVQCGIFTGQVSLFHLGLNQTTASHGALISNVLPFMVLILAHFFIPGDRITLKKGLGVCMGFIGVVILFFDRPDLSSDLKNGDFIIMGAVLFWSVSAVYVKRINAHFHAIQITLYPMIFGIPLFLTAGYVWDDVMVAAITPTVVKALAFQAFVTTAFGFVAWNTLLQQYGTTALHSFIFIIPLSGVWCGVYFLDEPVTSHLLGAIIFIVAGILVVNLKRRKRPPVMPVS